MNLYTGDLHFGHRNCINFDHRPFKDIGDMDTTLIKLWNSRVDKDDDVWIVGDFCYRAGYQPNWYLRQLKGRKHLIIGNHDGVLFNDKSAYRYFETIDTMKMITDKDKEIVLCHYPLADWNKKFHGSWHIYAHIHNNTTDAYQYMCQQERALNAGCMINNYTPASFNELIRNNEIFKEAMREEKEM